jgi:hypothetical protein
VPGVPYGFAEQDKKSKRERQAAASISMPKGAGVIPGIGEKLAADPAAGAGDEPLGLGWNLSLPQITRKTGKGLAQYREKNLGR